MPREIRKDQAAAFTFRPPSPWASPTGLVLDPAGLTLETPTPTPDSTSTTVGASASNTRSSLLLSSAGGFARGKVYQVTDASFGTALVEVAAVDGNTIALVEPLPLVPDAGSAVDGVEVTLAVAASSTADLGLGYRAIIRQGGDERVRDFHVVRHPFVNPVDARMARGYMATWWPSASQASTEEWIANRAEEAGDLLQGRLLEIERYPHLYLSSQSFREAGLAALDLVMARNGFGQGGASHAENIRSLDIRLGNRVAGIAKSAIPYDANDDDAVAASEVRVSTGRLRR